MAHPMTGLLHTRVSTLFVETDFVLVNMVEVKGY